MITFEKGLSYNFMVERIAETKGNYYYVIQVENKECWIRMLPFEIYQSTKKIIRCEYRGVDSFGSHIFIEDRLSILYELYKEKEEYDFNYVKEGIDTEGYYFSVLKDKYELTHRLYEQLSPNQKNSKEPIRCTVISIDKNTKTLMLHATGANNTDYVGTAIPPTNNGANTIWTDAATLFKSINKETLINDYFYKISIPSCNQKNITNLYQAKNNKWIVQYIIFLDRGYKYILIQKGNLDELAKFTDLMISLINWAIAFKISKSKKFPKVKKYEGLQKAIKILQTNSLRSYKETLTYTENPISEIHTLFALFEVDPFFFNENHSFYKETCKMLYDSFYTKNISDTFQESKKEKCLKAFQWILSHRIKIERKRIISNIIQTYNLSLKMGETTNDKIFTRLYSLLKYPEHIDSQTIHSYIDMQPQALGAIACIVYGSKQLGKMEDSKKLLSDINNMFYFSAKYEKERTEKEDFDKIEEIKETVCSTKQQISNQLEIQSNETCFFLNLYKDGTYIVTEKTIFESSIVKSIAINPNIDKFILQCYTHGSVNKVPIRILQEKKRERRYLNGCYSQDCLKEIYVISEETYIVTVSLYNNDTFIKLYSTEYISEHLSLGLKGNQIVDSNVDSTEYFLISSEYNAQLPKRLVYNSPNPLGKNIKNPYYENDILTLKKMGVIKI